MIKPIETVYNGYRFRSRLEARWAVFFDQIGMEYQYEPEGFHLNDGTFYLPDFYLPWFKCWVEIKPNGMDKETYETAEKNCIKLFEDLENQITMLCIGDPMDANMRIFCNDSSDGGAGIMYDGWKAKFLKGAHYIDSSGEGCDSNNTISICVDVCRDDRVLCTYNWDDIKANIHYAHEVISYRDDFRFEMQMARQARFEYGESGLVSMKFGDKTIPPALFKFLYWNDVHTLEELKNKKLGEILRMHGAKENINEIINIL